MTVRRRRLLEGRQREVIEEGKTKKVWATRRVRDDAFELYWRMGEGRSYRKVAEAINRSIGVVNKWGFTYEWERRVRERDEEIRKRVSEHIVSEEVAARVRYGSYFDQLLANFFTYFNKLGEEGKRMGIINSIDDLERVVRIALLLKGDRLEQVDGSGRMVMESTTIKKLVADPVARESLETLWRRLPVVQGQIEVDEAGG